MKACVPTVGDSGLDEEASPNFGRASTFTIIDLETEEDETIPNPNVETSVDICGCEGANASEHQAGCEAIPEIIEKRNVKAVICLGMEPGARARLKDRGIDTYVGKFRTVKDAIDLWKFGKLHEATDRDLCESHLRHEK